MQTAFIAKAEDGTYIAEASDLGCRPGEWPYSIEHDGQVFIRAEADIDERENELLAYNYRCVATGAVMKVFND